MSDTNSMRGCQTIGCQIASCRHHSDRDECELERINVEPMCGCHTGEACDESFCASYKTR